MSNKNGQPYEIIARGDLIMLRQHLEMDRDPYKRWQTQGVWREFDAPWDQNKPDNQKQEKHKERKQIIDDSGPRKMAVIATLENQPLGWVSRYSFRDNPEIWFVGIDICEDNYLNQGIGTEALNLWVDYLFANSNFHKLCLDTWSMNPRMMCVAEKIGFVYEGSQREMQFWQDEWLDLVHYGMLRREWEAKHQD